MVSNWEPTPQERAGLRNRWEYWKSLERAARSCFYCRKPIHITPAFKGESMGPDPSSPMWGYEMTYPLSCKSRLAEVCPSCSLRYGFDVDRLVQLGLEGDDENVPATVSANPQIFFTVTGPRFGPVHHAIERKGHPGQCHPGPKRFCEHGVKISCNKIHREKDPLIGTPMCPDCYDLEGHILWNRHAPKLWNRTVRELERELAKIVEPQMVKLAKILDVDRSELPNQIVVNCVKTAESQTRLAIHYHGFVRLDGPNGQGSALTVKVSAAQLAKAFEVAARRVRVHETFTASAEDLGLTEEEYYSSLEYDDENSYVDENEYLGDDPHPIRCEFAWGEQIEVTVLNRETARRLTRYVVKYATKGATDAHGFAYRFRSVDQIDALPDSAWWPKLLARTCWQMADNARFARLNLRRSANTFGFNGHFLTKSRNWSVTFAALHTLRAKWAAEHADPENPPEMNVPSWYFGNPDVSWRMVGKGWLTRLDAFEVRERFEVLQDGIRYEIALARDMRLSELASVA